jgi:hypothetical protein
MPSLRPSALTGALAVALFAVSIAPAHAAAVTPAAGDRVVANAAIIGSEFQQLLEEPATSDLVNFPGFIDPTSGVRVYHRDDGLLFAVSTKRNLTLRERAYGEREAAEVARKLLQEKFGHLFQTEAGFTGLDADAVRVVFVEPDATSPYIRGGSVVGQGSWYGAPSRYNAGMGSGFGGAGACGSCTGFSGGSTSGSGLGDAAAFGGSGPRAFAPAGFWAGSSSQPAPCTGCH